MNRCINIDWLEVYSHEDTDSLKKDAHFFRSNGYEVKERTYGTPQYAEMFTIFLNGFPYIEIRRSPYSIKGNGGIFDKNSCHIRLSNRTCYFANPINELRKFMIAFSYAYNSITRIDICLDFNLFDKGDDPQLIIKDYMEGKISKINQSRLAAHGRDTFETRIWNSLSWGSPNSCITTKLYCKSLEMKEVKRKFYIEDSWLAAGLDLNKEVWRVEFSIKSDLKHFLKLDTGEIIKNDLSSYDSRDKCLFRFHSLAHRYFHFKIISTNRNGNIQRKDRCEDKILFEISHDEKTFKPIRITTDTEPSRTDRMLMKKLAVLCQSYDINDELRKAARDCLVYYAEQAREKELMDITDKLFLLHEY